MKRFLIAVALMWSLGGVAFAADAPTKRPDWCKPGFECLTTQELAETTVQLWQQRKELARLQSQSKRFGWTAGVGLGVGGVVDDKFNTRAVPTGGAFVVWGVRF